jgi:hypothetical protein
MEIQQAARLSLGLYVCIASATKARNSPNMMSWRMKCSVTWQSNSRNGHWIQSCIKLFSSTWPPNILRLSRCNVSFRFSLRWAPLTVIAGNAPDTILRTYFYYLRLNVKTFFTLLQILQSELERLSEGDDVTQNGNRAPQLSDKITAVARRVLPALRIYSTWFTRFWQVLNANIANTLTTVEVQELWKAYAGTLTLLASSFPADKLKLQIPEDSYMLEEDVDTVGFQPLVSPETMKLWYNGETLKSKWSDLERSHPNIEMLIRIHDFLVDGLLLVQTPDAPLDLDGMRFIYREDGVPSELLASPNNPPGASPTISAEPLEMPMFPTMIPTAEDQGSYSVAAPSEGASTTIAKDSAMNRMVDDLVGPDDGLDPLPEEDENIPPTPPAQTFEDTVVTENTYGLGSFTVSDLVHSVTNYKKSTASPAPVTPVYATPMNRIGSSSSIRQPANLPSLPDGQYSGASIWNRNYNGTPGPSSPLLNNAFDVRGSPLNDARISSVSGHVRGDSSASLRSNDWNFSSTTPVQQPMSGGLGSGSTWGNPGASVYNSVYGQSAYGHNYSHGYGADTTDINLASPLLFGKDSAWNSQAHSSYGRTPPNGQGG